MRAILVLTLAFLVATVPVAADAVSTTRIAEVPAQAGSCCCPPADDVCADSYAPACGCGCRATTPSEPVPVDGSPPPAPLDVRASIAASSASQPTLAVVPPAALGIEARQRSMARDAREAPPSVCATVCCWLI